MITESSSKTYWPLFPRKVIFDWQTTPLHWIPQSPLASQPQLIAESMTNFIQQFKLAKVA